MKKLFFFFSFTIFVFCSLSARADFVSYTGHDGVSVASAASIVEKAAIRFGNFSVSNPGGNDANIVLAVNGTRTRNNGASTTITLLNGGASDYGSQGQGFYDIIGAGNDANVYITFKDHTGAAITAGNPVVLTGPVGSDEFYVDSLTFNNDGTDGDGDYITMDGGGNATAHVGATLHTKAGATAYAPGTYRGTFEIMISY